MEIRKVGFAVVACFASIAVSSQSAFAVQVIAFPDVATPNLVYSEIEESNNSIVSGQSLFAGVSSSGDTLRLQSTAFSTSRTGAIDFLEGNFDTTITANPGWQITGITVTENGSAMTFGAGTVAYMNMEASIIPSNDSLMMDDREFTMVGAAGPPSSTTWMRSLSFAIAPSQEVLFTLRNQLLVDGTSGVAAIGKDKVVIGVRVTAIPEPSSTLALAVTGVGLIAARRRRRI